MSDDEALIASRCVPGAEKCEPLRAALAAVRAELDRANLVIEGLVEDKESALRRMIARRNERDEANGMIAAVRALADEGDHDGFAHPGYVSTRAIRSALGSSTGTGSSDG